MATARRGSTSWSAPRARSRPCTPSRRSTRCAPRTASTRARADAHLELGGLVDLYQWEMGNPALLFDQIGGYQPGHRLLANVFTSLRRIALSLNLPLEYGPREFVQAWRTQLKELQPRPAVLQE